MRNEEEKDEDKRSWMLRVHENPSCVESTMTGKAQTMHKGFRIIRLRQRVGFNGLETSDR